MYRINKVIPKLRPQKREKGVREMLKTMNCMASKLVVPKSETNVFLRPKLNDKLEQVLDYPVTTVSAGAGYGKTTAVVQLLASTKVPHGWYSIGPEDAGVYTFASYLVCALESIVTGIKDKVVDDLGKLATLGWDKLFRLLLPYLEQDQLKDSILVFDDWHLLSKEKGIVLFLDQFLTYKPDWLHIIIISREKVDIPAVYRLGVRGQGLFIEEKELALDAEEVRDYLAQGYAGRVSQKDVQQIYQYSEGWIMALKLISRGFKEGSLPLEGEQNNSLHDLFEFLVLDVLEQQDATMQSFLLKCSVLDYLSVPACSEVMGSEFTPQLIYRALNKGLFLSELDNGLFRYHYLFRDLLRREARNRLPDYAMLHCRAGNFYLKEGQEEQAIHHLLRAGQWADAAEILFRISRDLAYSGRDQLLSDYLKRLPLKFQKRPEFLLAMGDVERQTSNYHAALQHYQEAREKYSAQDDKFGLSRALKGIGETYLDIIEPTLAGECLRQAYKVLGEENALEKEEILSLMAENMINQGKPSQAKRYRQLANEMLHLVSRGNYEARLLLRTGRLEGVIQLLESKVPQEKGSYHPSLSFRETPLLLSLAYSFIGEADKAEIAAEEGIRLGQKLKSPFVEAMGYVRLGHALLVQKGQPTQASRKAYQRALDINDSLGVIRGRTEVMMGLCLLYGMEGDWMAAKRSGLEGIRVAERVKDRWFTAVLYHCLGVAAATCRNISEAKDYLLRAKELFQRCGDSFGKTVSSWWLANIAFQEGERAEFRQRISELLELSERFGYDFLLQKATALGSRDGRASVPLLLEARRQNIALSYVEGQLHKLGVEENLPVIAYTLRIQTLGKFRVWRGGEEINPLEWRRNSAKRLFQLLLTKRKTILHRDEIMAYLWPDSSLEVVTRDFKVALNTLQNTLEPERQSRSPSFFVQREGSAYFFNLASGFRLDSEEFESLIARAQLIINERAGQAETLLKRALDLYEGDYLQGVTQEEWCLDERDRLMVIYIRAAELFANILAGKGDYEGCIEWADRILEKDNCWEAAYRLKIFCYGKQNNRVLATRVYQKCKAVLQEELNVVPSLKTVRLYKKLSRTLTAV